MNRAVTPAPVPAGSIAANWDRHHGTRAGAWRGIAVAALLTLALFVLLPVMDHLSPPPAAAPRAVPVETIPPPVLPAPKLPPAPRDPPAPTPPAPRLAEPRPHLAIGAPLRVDLRLAPVPADLSVRFAVTPELSLAGAADSLVFDIVDTDRMPQPLARLPPLYPPQARMRRIEGEVHVEFIVTPAGGVTAAQIVAAQPPGVFDQTALQSVQRWRFEPGLKDGQPVAVRVRQKLTFKLEE